MKKKIIAMLLCLSLVFNSCGKESNTNEKSVPTKIDNSTPTIISEENEGRIIDSLTPTVSEAASIENDTIDTTQWNDEASRFVLLDDPELLDYIDERVYWELTDRLNSEDYIIEGVESVYISKEYVKELEYNSKKNIFFGKTLEELDQQFEGQKYVFTLGEDGSTTVIPFEEYKNPYEQIIKNVLIGSGVILVCATVSVCTGGTVSIIFAASAKTGTIMALQSAGFSAILQGAITGIKTKDLNAALYDSAVGASEGFKFGAIVGAVTGGIVAHKILNTPGLVVADDALKTGMIDFPEDDFLKWLSDQGIDITKLDHSKISEYRALFYYGGSEQVSFLANQEVSITTPDATRPDVWRKVKDTWEAIEVKNYDLSNSNSVSSCCNKLKQQIESRIENLPEGSTQRIVLDVTDRNFSQNIIDNAVGKIKTTLKDIYPDIPIDIIGAA